jgi:hypothetical protein
MTADSPSGVNVSGTEPTPTRDDLWVECLGDPNAVDSHPELFSGAFSQLASLLAQEHGLADEVRRVLSVRRAGVPSESALIEVTEGLKSLLGVDATYLLHWLAYMDTFDRLAELSSLAPPDVHAFLRSAMAEHSRTLDSLQRMSLLGADGLYDVTPAVPLDVLTGQITYRLDLAKNDGTRVRLTLTPELTASFAAQLIQLLSAPNDGDLLPPEAQEGLDEAMAEFRRVFQPSELDEPEEGR